MKQKVLWIGAAASAALFFCSGWMLVYQWQQKAQSVELFQSLALLLEEESNTAVSSHSFLTPSEKNSTIYAQNSDFVGWLSIDGTNIHYPVVQSVTAPNFYLNHGFDKTYSVYGTPYMQENCSLNNSDNIVIYAHNMNDSAMFADLCKYEKEDFYKAHPLINFDTLTEFGTYAIIAAFKTVAYSEQGFPYYNFVQTAEQAQFDTFVETCKNLSLYDTGLSAEYGERLLTLSTCEYSQPDGRMVVVAKQVLSSDIEVTG